MAEFLGCMRRVSMFTGPSVPLAAQVDLSGKGMTASETSGHYPPLGKLGLKEEAAGKVRVFAMVDAWSQWLLHPLHKVLQSLLRSLSEDATFNQVGKLEAKLSEMMVKAYRVPKAFSYDLSSATDRLPVSLQVKILTPLLGKEKAEAWARILVERDYLLPQLARGGTVHYRDAFTGFVYTASSLGRLLNNVGYLSR